METNIDDCSVYQQLRHHVEKSSPEHQNGDVDDDCHHQSGSEHTNNISKTPGEATMISQRGEHCGICTEKLERLPHGKT